MTDLLDLGRSVVDAVAERVGRGISRLQERRPLAADLLESDEHYLIVFDAPGATASDVQVRFRSGEVRVRVDRFRSFHEGYEMRFPGRGLALTGRERLPPDADVDPTAASATVTDRGTLHVEVPTVETGEDVPVSDDDAGSEAVETSDEEGDDEAPTADDDG